eukprot:c27969_g1_i1 orf=1-156(-)
MDIKCQNLLQLNRPIISLVDKSKDYERDHTENSEPDSINYYEKRVFKKKKKK